MQWRHLTGARYSSALCTQAKHGKLSDDGMHISKQKGYIWPEPDGIRLSISQYYQPKGYQRLKDELPPGKVQICQPLAEMQRFVGEWMLTNKRATWATMARGVQRKHKVGACQSTMFCQLI